MSPEAIKTEVLDEEEMCLPRTLASVVSAVAGQKVALPGWIYEIRTRQLGLPETANEDAREASRLRWMIRKLQKDSSEAGRILRESEINYKKGDVEDVERALDEGGIVVVCATNRERTKSHIMHVNRVGPADVFSWGPWDQEVLLKSESDGMVEERKILNRRMGYHQGPFNMVTFSQRTAK